MNKNSFIGIIKIFQIFIMKQPNRYHKMKINLFVVWRFYLFEHLTLKLCTNIIIQQLKANKLYGSIYFILPKKKRSFFQLFTI